jgi:hypothetical protein
MEQTEASTGLAWVPQACTLPMAEQPLRVAAFERLLGEEVQGVERVAATRLHLDLRPEPQVAGRAAELAAAETKCCSFFTFTLTMAGGSVGLDVAVPPGYVSVLDALAERARGAGQLLRVPSGSRSAAVASSRSVETVRWCHFASDSARAVAAAVA